MKKKTCKKCGDGKYCHFCGRSWDNRGYARSFILRNKGPTHYICYSCAE